MGMLLSLIPQELWILVLLGTAFGVIFGIIPRGAIVGVIVCIFLLAFLGPIISSVLETMPAWISIILTIVFGLTLISWIINLVFGERTGSHLLALLTRDILLAPFRFVGFLFGRR
jgi:hypothetical protein